MTTCKDCIHYEMCKYNAYQEAHYFGKDKEIYVSIDNNSACKFFKSTADVAEVRHGFWELETHSFYADNWDENVELYIYITAKCGNCGRKHPDVYEVHHKRLYAPEDAPEDFRFDKKSEEDKALKEFKERNYKFAQHCPDCGAKMDEN